MAISGRTWALLACAWLAAILLVWMANGAVGSDLGAYCRGIGNCEAGWDKGYFPSRTLESLTEVALFSLILGGPAVAGVTLVAALYGKACKLLRP
jgi:hypothetical protein